MINTKTLYYFANYTATPINLNIWESEMYYAAIPVQQLIGNLVYYSNFGRYELRLAESWNNIDNFTWVFTLKKGLVAENGELITPTSFKKSIERSLFIMSRNDHTPILKHLVGYESFLHNNSKFSNIFQLVSLEGIQIDNENLIFKFTRPIRDGLLQILSFAPYGYICEENFNSDGSWRNNQRLVSSGPFRVGSFPSKNNVILVKSPSWKNPFAENSPETIDFRQGLDDELAHKLSSKGDPVILDSFSALEYFNPSNFSKYEVVQEYFKGIALGNFSTGLFRDQEVRHQFSAKFQNFKKKIIKDHLGTQFVDSIYPTQDPIESVILVEKKITSSKTLIISGKEPLTNSRNWLPWIILKNTLDHFELKYKFSNSSYSRDDITNKNYDIRIVGPSVGGGVESWVLDVLFCSKFNSNLPDPSNGICKLINDFDYGNISEEELASKFFKVVKTDAAILPVNLFGVQLYLNKSIKTSSISPLLSIMRFDQVEIE